MYQKSIVPIADVLLPNQFEAEKLSGMSITCEADGWKVRNMVVMTTIKINMDQEQLYFLAFK